MSLNECKPHGARRQDLDKAAGGGCPPGKNIPTDAAGGGFGAAGDFREGMESWEGF